MVQMVLRLSPGFVNSILPVPISLQSCIMTLSSVSTIDSRYVRPALSVISPQNHAGYLWIVTVLGLIYTFIVAFARVCEKIRMLGVDDLILGLATVNP